MTLPLACNERLAQALPLHEQRNYPEAEGIYCEVLAEYPESVDALQLYAMLLHETNRSEGGLPFIERAIEIRPDLAPLHNAKAVILIAIGQLSAAELACREAIRLAADFPEAHRNLGMILERQGRVLDAIEALQQVLHLDPRRSDVLKELAGLCEQENRTDLTVAACVAILKKMPESVAAHLTLGLLFASRILPERLANVDLQERTRLTNLALRHLESAATIYPCAETMDAWGNALLNANLHHEALAKFDIALGHDPRFAKSLEGRGRAFLELGDVAKAIDDFRAAVDISPELAMAQIELAKIDRQSEQQQALDRLLKILPNPADATNTAKWRSPTKRRAYSLMLYAVAHRLEKLGDFASAFDYFDMANKAKLSNTTATREDPIEKTVALKEAFRPTAISACQSQCESQIPIFIVSMPRSGTTLTEQIIASHPQVEAGGELFEISDIAHTLNRRLNVENAYPECITELTTQSTTSMAEEYLTQARQRCVRSLPTGSTEDDWRMTDKMPTNFWHVGLIHCLFPMAKIIHVQRHPLDVCLSCFKQNLTWPFCDLDGIVDYYASYVELMKYWKSTLPIAIHTIEYENLVSDPESHTRALLDFCGLPWNDACLNHASAKNSVQTPSKWQVRQPIYRSSMGNWRRYENQLRPLADQLIDRGVLGLDDLSPS